MDFFYRMKLFNNLIFGEFSQLSENCTFTNSDPDIYTTSLVNFQGRQYSWNSQLTIASSSMYVVERSWFLTSGLILFLFSQFHNI